MKDNVCVDRTTIEIPKLVRQGLFRNAAIVALACAPWLARADEGNGEHYRQTNLVSDQPGKAMLLDTNLVNAWGMSSSPTSPIWVSDNGSGLSTLYAVTYDAMGTVQVAKQPLEVAIPGDGTPTGQVFDGTGSFNGDIFIFASEDGTISGWRGSLGSAAEVLVQRSTAVYKGITLVTTAKGPTLLAANFAENSLDAYDTSLTLIGQFSDPNGAAGYAPFNVQVVGGAVFVTFAKQDDQKHDDVKGPGHGFIDIFDPMQLTFQRFATGSDAGGHLHTINSPWGLAASPKGFGRHSDELLIGNFGSGTIMSFEADGKYRGLLLAERGGPVTIDGLWGLRFGNGGKGGRPSTLYFSAGPDDEGHGLFGSLDAVQGRDQGDQGEDED